tara:strand:- start:4887 stop:5279 length:393 start_codon:yes stop_codon:yes gene_type:complete
MSPKIVLITIGALMTLHGIGLYLVAGSTVEYTNPTEVMITMGVKLNETTAIMTLLVGVILLVSNNIETNSAKKVVVGTGISMGICCAFSAERYVNQVWNGEGGPPVFIPIIFGLLTIWSFYVGLKKDPSK